MHGKTGSISASLSVLLLSAVACLGAGGCATTSERLVLEQPFAPPSQKYLVLKTRSADAAEFDGRAALLLECPLPAAKDGPIAYSIYIDVPRAVGEFAVGSESEAAHAMVIQRVGALAGKSVFDSGRVDIRRPAFTTDQFLVTIDLRAKDETALRGAIHAKLNDAAIRQFASDYRSDVEALRAATASDGQALTQPRVAGD